MVTILPLRSRTFKSTIRRLKLMRLPQATCLCNYTDPHLPTHCISSSPLSSPDQPPSPSFPVVNPYVPGAHRPSPMPQTIHVDGLFNDRRHLANPLPRSASRARFCACPLEFLGGLVALNEKRASTELSCRLRIYGALITASRRVANR